MPPAITTPTSAERLYGRLTADKIVILLTRQAGQMMLLLRHTPHIFAATLRRRLR